MKKISAVLLTIFLATAASFAQNTTGKIVGAVAAPDGAIPGATVVVTDNQTQKERTVTANEDGTFEVPQLEFGTYTVRVSAPGYKTLTTNDVKIDVGREFSLNVQLEVGAVTEEVTVTADGGEQINASNAELSNTVSTQQIRELPLNGRNPLALITLQAGANATTTSINGQRSSATTITRDGLNVQDNFIRTGRFVSDQPTVDDTGEFTITTQNAGAEQGGGSSLIQLVTPRGGSEYHGNLYIFNRNSEFAANSFFNNSTINAATGQGVARPFLNQNQFGGSISGPVPFFNFGEGGPVFDKNKAFFFFNYETFRLAQQATITGLTTLLPQARTGLFTFVDAGGVTRNVNVLTGSGFTTGLTAAQGGVLSVNPIIQRRLLDRLPTAGNGITTGTNFLQAVTVNRGDPRTRNSYTTRFDYDFNDRNTLNLVYRRNDDVDARTDIAAGFENGVFVNTKGPTDFFVAAFRTTIGNNFSNEVRGGYQDSGVIFDEGDTVPDDFNFGTGLPFTNPEGTFRTQGRNTLYRNIQDNAVYSIGNHSLRFGGQIEFQETESFNLAATGGNVTQTFNIQTTGNPAAVALAITATQICGTPTCINATDLARIQNLRFVLGGIVGTGAQVAFLGEGNTFGFQASRLALNYKVNSLYASDQWRVNPNLTLNFGLRYEYYTPLNNKDLRYIEPIIPDPNNLASITNPGGTFNIVGTNVGSPGDFFNPDRNNFSPNVSFAYSPTFEKGILAGLLGGQTVLRGGFRLGYVNDEYLRAPDAFNSANTGLGAAIVNATNGAGSTNFNAALTPTAGFEGLPNFILPPSPTLPRTFLANNPTRGGALFGVDPNYQIPRIFEYNVGIQREIGFKNIMELRYVGSFSNDYIRSIDFNQVDTINNGFITDFLRAQSNLAITDAERARRNALCTGTAAQILACQTAVNTALPRTAAFNGLPGSQQLPVFNNLNTTAAAGALNNANNLTLIQQGLAGSLAQNYILNGLQGGVRFQPTTEIFSAEVLTNGGKYRYNALQAEIRSRFTDGFYQVNYTFQKTLADVPDDSQLRQSPYQDNNNPGLQYGRPDFDRTHTLNANAVYELPFGKGKRFFNGGGIANVLFGGFQFGSIVQLSSGAPLGIIDPRGTTARPGRSGRQSAISSLTTKEIKELTGIFRTPNGIYFVNPSVLNAQATNGTVTQRVDLTQPLPAGFTLLSVRAANPVGTAPFDGQVFFFNNAGQTGNLPRNFINGAPFLNWNASLNKNFNFTEDTRLQLRFEVFNVLNKQLPQFNLDLNIDSTNFSRVTTSINAPRVVQFGARLDF